MLHIKWSFYSTFFILIASAIKGEDCDREKCYKQVMRECAVVMDQNHNNTGRYHCERMTNFFECRQREYQRLSEKECRCEGEKNMNEKQLKYNKEICDEDGDIFKAIESNRDCIHENTMIGDNICEWNNLGDEKQQILQENAIPECSMRSLWIHQCPNAYLGYKCGDEVKDMIIKRKKLRDEIFKHDDECSEKAIDLLEMLIAVFKDFGTIHDENAWEDILKFMKESQT